MSDEKDEPAPIDWDEARKAALNMAEMVWSYHQALLSMGFNETQALALSLAYQEHFLP